MAEHCRRPMIYDAASDTILCPKCKQVWIAANPVPMAMEAPVPVKSPSYNEANRTMFVAMGRSDLLTRLIDGITPASESSPSPEPDPEDRR